MDVRRGMSEYEAQAELYDRLSPGLLGDVEFYRDLALEAGSPVLELGCGTGRVTIPVALAGVPIVGLDSARPMLDIARREAQGVKGIRWVEGDMRDFSLRERFGLIFIPYRGFLHLLTAGEQMAALAAVFRHLAPGGRLALNIFNPAIVSPLISPPRLPYGEMREGRTRGREADKARAILSRTNRGLPLRYIVREEMEELLLLSGFEVQALYGWFDRRPFDRLSSEMVWIARRPEGRGWPVD